MKPYQQVLELKGTDFKLYFFVRKRQHVDLITFAYFSQQVSDTLTCRSVSQLVSRIRGHKIRLYVTWSRVRTCDNIYLLVTFTLHHLD